MLIRFPKIHNHQVLLIVAYLIITTLTLNSLFAIYSVFKLFSEDLINSFYFFLILIAIAFLTCSTITINEIIKVLKRLKATNVD